MKKRGVRGESTGHSAFNSAYDVSLCGVHQLVEGDGDALGLLTDHGCTQGCLEGGERAQKHGPGPSIKGALMATTRRLDASTIAVESFIV